MYSVYCKRNKDSGVDSKEIVRILKQDGWKKHNQKGSHCQYKHPVKKGKVTVPHPKKDLPIKTAQSILKQAGIDKRGI